MIRRTSSLIAVLAALAATGCPAVSPPVVVSSTVPPRSEAAAVVAGKIVAPPGLSGAEAEVFLADAGGRPMVGTSSVKADKQGRFTLKQVPVGTACVVVVRLKGATGDVQLRSLTIPGELGASAEVSPASTLVVAGVTAGLEGVLREYNLARYARAVQVVGENLQATSALDWASSEALAAELAKLEGAHTVLKADLEALRADLKSPLKPGAAPSEAPATPLPTPSPSVVIYPSASPSAARTPRPRPTVSFVPTTEVARIKDLQLDGTLSENATIQPKDDEVLISAREGNDYYGTNFKAPRLMKAIKGNFQVTVRIFDEVFAVGGFLASGLLLTGEGGHSLRFERSRIALDNTFIHGLAYRGPTQVVSPKANYPWHDTEVVLRLTRQDDWLFLDYNNPQAEGWKSLSAFPIELPEEVEVGVFVINATNPELYQATFRDFAIWQ